MKLLLISSDFKTKEINSALAELVGKDLSKMSVAIINEAHAVEEGDKRWNIEELNRLIQTVGGEVDLISLQVLSKQKVAERIKNKDVIFVAGGHTDYLMSVFNKSGFSDLLPDLLKDKVYVGSSAGSMVMGKRVSTTFYKKIFGEGETYGTTKYLELVDFAIKPHLDSPEFPNRSKEVYIEAAQGYDGIIYGLRDDQAIVVKDGEIEFIGGKPLSLQKGKNYLVFYYGTESIFQKFKGR